MGLFTLKKKTPCSCQTEVKFTKEEIESAKIIVLGECCDKSKQTYINVKEAAVELNLNEKVINVGNMSIIASFGVMQTPALVISKKVVSYGKLISKEEAIKYLKENL